MNIISPITRLIDQIENIKLELYNETNSNFTNNSINTLNFLYTTSYNNNIYKNFHILKTKDRIVAFVPKENQWINVSEYIKNPCPLLLDYDDRPYKILAKFIDISFVSKIIIKKISLSEYLILKDFDIFNLYDVYVKCINVTNRDNINKVPIDIKGLEISNMFLTVDYLYLLEGFFNLEYLDISENMLTEFTLRLRLKHLNLRGNKRLKILNINKSYLQSIDISETLLTPENLLEYKSLSKIVYTDSDYQFRKLPNLENECIEYNNLVVKINDLNIFNSFHCLKYLFLEFVVLMDEIINLNNLSKTITHLKVTGDQNIISDTLTHLTQYSRNNSYLKCPLLKEVYIESDNINIANIIESKVIQKLTLKNNGRNEIHNIDMLNDFKHIKILDISDANFPSSHSFNLDSLKEISLNASSFILRESSFSKPENLIYMNINNITIYSNFTNYKNLKDLTLSNIRLNINAANLFPNGLEKLSLDFSIINHLNNALLINLKKLNEITLKYKGSSERFKDIFINLPMLRKVTLITNNVKDLMFNGLTKITSLCVQYDTTDTSIYDINRSFFLNMPNIESLELVYPCYTYTLDMLKNFNNLSSLKLYNINNNDIKEINHVRTLEYLTITTLGPSAFYISNVYKAILQNNEYLVNFSTKDNGMYTGDHKYCNK